MAKSQETGRVAARKAAGGKMLKEGSASTARMSAGRMTKQAGRGRGRGRGATATGRAAAQRGGSRGLQGRSASQGKRQATTSSAEQLRKRMLRRKRQNQIVFQCDWKRRGHAKRLVFLGVKQKTSGGLIKRDLKKNKRGRIVSKVRSAHGKARFLSNRLDRWCQSLLMARKDMRLKGFVKIKAQRNGGKGVSAELHRRMREHWALLMLNAVNQSLSDDGSGRRFAGIGKQAKEEQEESKVQDVKRQPTSISDFMHFMKKEM